MKKTPSKVAHNRTLFFIRFANMPKTIQSLIFCSIKMAAMRDFYIMTLHTLDSGYAYEFWKKIEEKKLKNDCNA